jgi:hypothetical protein
VIGSDPMFVDAANGDFHLAGGSPAIDAGLTSVGSIVTTDFDLKPRSETSIDIGAFTH